MKKYLTNVLLLLCLLTACSEDWMKDFAPTSIRNKGLCLSMGETMNNWYIKILQKSQNEVLMVANDASWKLSDFYCEYSKTGTNEGFLIIEYTINIGEMSVEHYEELTLNFSSAHGGTFDGIDEYYSNGIERENFKCVCLHPNVYSLSKFHNYCVSSQELYTRTSTDSGFLYGDITTSYVRECGVCE